MCVWCACESRYLWRPGALNPLKGELQGVESYLMWALGTELRFIGRAKCS